MIKKNIKNNIRKSRSYKCGNTSPYKCKKHNRTKVPEKISLHNEFFYFSVNMLLKVINE